MLLRLTYTQMERISAMRDVNSVNLFAQHFDLEIN